MRQSILSVTTCLLLSCFWACGQPETKKEAGPKIAAAVPEAPADGAKVPAPTGPTDVPKATRIDHTVQDIDGADVNLAEYRGRAMLIVNTASECGNTPQYAGLQELHQKYGDRGLTVLGFPSNDFGGQEPGTQEEIKAFTKEKFGVTFPLFAKIKTKGAGQAPLYKSLTKDSRAPFRGEVQWNFAKFLVDVNGQVVARFGNKVEPTSAEVIEAIENALPSEKAG